MEHQPLRHLRDIADVEPVSGLLEGRRARLERWAEILDREPTRSFTTLEEIEFVPRRMRAAIRADNSPIAYAYADPVLRASGLSGDTFGDARSFFELSTGEAHHLLCSCVNGRSVTGSATARRLRRLAAKRPGLWLAYGCAAAVVSLPGLLYLLA
ncbi:hypothetical protein [Methylobacterium nodulans]|uniref:Uncharacterized protein n=1 Tax=Methylobacterium nodulans (strain LMG 21967 / CNCM I-2342 / ORS 2060) TaxID=460265 RepID=B8IN37_METNO|nr:hypothetical protein [Methylobacterium nodulans]ACL62153.1 conserved hypothetical protein [Methylobacterium nodulans ORS 2060]